MSALARAAVLIATFAGGLMFRTWGIHRHFWLLGDQIRDWSIALRPLVELPPRAFYWGLWIIRLAIGPSVDNLPHAAAIGQAILQSSADALLLAAVWRLSGSLWIALATIVVVATASHDLSLSAGVWSSMMGLAFAKIATALVLLKVPHRSAAGASATAVVAWVAVQCDPQAIFVAIGVFAALVAEPFLAGNRPTLHRNLWIVAVVVAVLQIPHALQRPAESLTVNQISPWLTAWLAWLLVAIGAVAAFAKLRPLEGPVHSLASVGFVLLVAVLATAPIQPRFGWTRQRMPEYGALLDGSRKIAKVAQPMRTIRANFALPPTSDSEFLFTILGGRIDRASPWVGVIMRDGNVTYERVSPAR